MLQAMGYNTYRFDAADLVDFLLSATDQIVEHISDNETVLGNSRRLQRTVEHLIDGGEKRICRLSFQF